MEEFRVIGPPGCGKTSWIRDQVQAAVRAHGSGSVLLASLTRTAAKELATRKLPIRREQIGTIHAHALRAIGGHLELATSEPYVKAWNATESGKAWPMSSDEDDDIEDVEGRNRGDLLGDQLLHELGCNRARMLPEDLWLPTVREFAKAWQEFKDEAGSIDFTDMVDLAIKNTSHAPGNPAFIFLDEAQDVDKLQLTLMRQWAANAAKLIIVGDPYQNLYRWRGTDPNSFTTPEIPRENMRILSQSYRVPREVHRVAMQWIQSHANYTHYEYKPRDADGCVRSIVCDAFRPRSLPDQILADLEARKTVMVLGSYNLMLGPILTALRDAGIPYHNPYRVRNGAWNLFRHKDKILDYLQTDEEVWGDFASLWTWGQLHHWIGDLESDGLLHRGAKKRVQSAAKADGLRDLKLTPSDLQEVFLPGACEVNDLAWYRGRVRASRAKQASLRYILTVAEKRGKARLREEPRVIVGTIHSVKGAEADVVYLFPNLSTRAMPFLTARALPEYSDLIRLFYVGITRAKETLVVCKQTHPQAGVPAWRLA